MTSIAPYKRHSVATWAFVLTARVYPFDTLWTFEKRFLGDIPIEFGPTTIIATSMTSPRIADSKTGAFPGKISYSVHLNHMMILNMRLIVPMSTYEASAVWIATIFRCLIIFYSMYLIIENPSLNAGKAIMTGKPAAMTAR